jgi:hypothetical protein
LITAGPKKHLPSIAIINKSNLDSFFDALEKGGVAMGSIAISKNGNIQYQRAIGQTQP